MRSIKSRFVMGSSNMLFAACMCALFSPENLQAGAVKGLNVLIPKQLTDYYATTWALHLVFAVLYLCYV